MFGCEKLAAVLVSRRNRSRKRRHRRELGGQHLERHVPVEPHVAGQIDGSHAAATEPRSVSQQFAVAGGGRSGSDDRREIRAARLVCRHSGVMTQANASSAMSTSSSVSCECGRQ